MWRFGDDLATSTRLAGRVTQWAWKLESARLHHMTVRSTMLLREEYPAIHYMYTEVFRTLRQGLWDSDRLRGRAVVDIWVGLLEIVIPRSAAVGEL